MGICARGTSQPTRRRKARRGDATDQPTPKRRGGMLWSRRPEPLAPSSPALRGEAGRGSTDPHPPQPVLPPKPDPIGAPFVCTIPLKPHLRALIGLSLMSKQTTTAAK